MLLLRIHFRHSASKTAVLQVVNIYIRYGKWDMESKAGKYVGNNIIFTKMMCPFHKNKAKK